RLGSEPLCTVRNPPPAESPGACPSELFAGPGERSMASILVWPNARREHLLVIRHTLHSPPMRHRDPEARPALRCRQGGGRATVGKLDERSRVVRNFADTVVTAHA